MKFNRDTLLQALSHGWNQADTKHGPRRLVGVAKDFALAKESITGRVHMIAFRDIRDLREAEASA